jgi:hypothetical protein
MRRLLAALILLTGLWLPIAAAPPVVHASVCTGWVNGSTPPPTIKVYRTNLGRVDTVDFKTYVKVVMAAEWSPSFLPEALKAGAVTVKQFAWYWAMNYRGGSNSGNCYDVIDNSNDQIYTPERYSPTANQAAAVDATWDEYITGNGYFLFTGYKPGTQSCGADVDGVRLSEWGAQYCAAAPNNKTSEQILTIYFGAVVIGHVTPLPVAGPATFHPLTPRRVLDTRDGTGGLTGLFKSRLPRTFQVTGDATGVPSAATAVTGILTITQARGSGYLYIGPEALSWPTSSSLNFSSGDDRANSVSVRLGGTGTLSVTFVSGGNLASAHVLLDITGYYVPGAGGDGYVPVKPKRILDTRDGTGGLSDTFAPWVPRTFQVTGAASGIPAEATAVTGILTVATASGRGYLYIGPAEQAQPTTSSLNFPAWDARANSVTVILGTLGTLSITYASAVAGAGAQTIFDITGYYLPGPTGATYMPLTPTRILDTRDGTGGLVGTFTPWAPRTFQASGDQRAVPAVATAVTGILTVTQAGGGGFLVVGPEEQAQPTTSSLNFPQADDRANAVSVMLGATGTLSITYGAGKSTATAHAIFDLTGYFAPPAATT